MALKIQCFRFIHYLFNEELVGFPTLNWAGVLLHGAMRPLSFGFKFTLIIV